MECSFTTIGESLCSIPLGRIALKAHGKIVIQIVGVHFNFFRNISILYKYIIIETDSVVFTL